MSLEDCDLVLFLPGEQRKRVSAVTSESGYEDSAEDHTIQRNLKKIDLLSYSERKQRDKDREMSGYR